MQFVAIKLNAQNEFDMHELLALRTVTKPCRAKLNEQIDENGNLFYMILNKKFVL